MELLLQYEQEDLGYLEQFLGFPVHGQAANWLCNVVVERLPLLWQPLRVEYQELGCPIEEIWLR